MRLKQEQDSAKNTGTVEPGGCRILAFKPAQQ